MTVMNPNIEAAVYPEHSYVDNIYWADLPWAQRLSWINKQSNAEAKRELCDIWKAFKKDPLGPISSHWKRYVLTGMGLFIEGYVLFSIGNVKSLYSAAWPQCWQNFEVCNKTWTQSVDYLEIVGIIVGQILIGIVGDWMGRKRGMLFDAFVMLLGSAMLTASWGISLQGWVIMYAWSLFFFGIGVGGEYPMTATRALEGFHTVTDRLHRGRTVVLSFLQQGWGQLFNQGILIICLLIFNSGSAGPYSEGTAQATFRVQFGFMVLVCLGLLYYRGYKIEYTDEALNRAKARDHITGYDVKSLKLATRHYWHRMLGTAGCWFCNDYFFYGNKIFQGAFIAVIHPGGSSIMTNWLWNLLNVGVSLVGYYMAALTIDWKLWGRKRMQAMGFFMDFVLFMVATALFTPLQNPGGPIKVFQFIYFFSSFWNQFGPNCTTFLLAAEIYPAEIRGTAHGLSAAVGKLGALAPAILYNYIDNHTKFWVVTWFGLLGLALTVLFIPDVTGLDLKEQDRWWASIRVGGGKYHGPAVNPRHLSLWEILVKRVHRQYDPVKAAEERLEEIKAHALQARKKMEGKKTASGDDGYDSDIDSAIVDYFAGESAENGDSYQNGST